VIIGVQANGRNGQEMGKQKIREQSEVDGRKLQEKLHCSFWFG
jgi:hypothetical protein